MSEKNIITSAFEKIKNLGSEIAFHLGAGMQKVNNEAFSGYGENVDGRYELTINQQAESNRVARDLLDGVQSQAVKELAYRTVLIDEEAKDYEYFSESLALRYENKYYNVKKPNADMSDGKKILFIQPNHISSLSVLQSFQQIGIGKDKMENSTSDAWQIVKDAVESGEVKEKVDEKMEKITIPIGKLGRFKGEPLVKITTNTVARFQMSDKLKQVVVKESDDENKVFVELYFNKYPLHDEWTSKPFIKELERIIFNGFRSSVLDIKSISFVTAKANGVRDNLKFGYAIDRYVSGGAHEGWYFLKFEATVVIDGEDIMAPLYCESMAEKYRTKAAKDYVIHLSPHTFNRSYVCEECGKVVEMSLEDLSNMPVDVNTDLDENGEFHTNSKVLSYYDMEVIEQTFGKKLCNECFKRLSQELTNRTQEQLSDIK